MHGKFHWHWDYITQTGGGPSATPTNTTYHTYDYQVPWKVKFDTKCLPEAWAGNIGLMAGGESISSVGGGPFVTVDYGWYERVDARLADAMSPTDDQLATLKEAFGCEDCCRFSAIYFAVDVALVSTTWWGFGFGLDGPQPIDVVDVNVPIFTFPSNSTVLGAVQIQYLHRCCVCQGAPSKTGLQLLETKVYNSKYPRYSDPLDVFDVPYLGPLRSR